MKFKLPKKIFPFTLFIVFLIAIMALVLGSLIWWGENTKPVSSAGAKQRFVVPEGASAKEVGDNLYKQGLIRNTFAYKVYVRASGSAVKIQPGIFNLAPNQPLTEIVKRLTRNPDELRITIPEGLRREEIVEILIKGLEIEKDGEDAFRSEFLSETSDKEGYLFPDTYDFLPGTSAKTVVLRLSQTFNKKIAESIKSYPSGYSLKDVVILASLIEREALTKDERPVVAGILYNRLGNSWPLQVDAAVQYAIATRDCKGSINCEWWPKNLTKDDLEINSPFNTYKFPGIPTSPISNPGLDSLSAAANPAPSDYFFYIHSDGKIYYAKTLEEHNFNIKSYLGK